ncbi:MAG: cyclic nucleotide-binding domain-containing protein, partial [Bdellovibrionales bacterium]|nr:cyclic nucleotide-binding domain-containing protein [Bdellovibrionales bacterium]
MDGSPSGSSFCQSSDDTRGLWQALSAKNQILPKTTDQMLFAGSVQLMGVGFFGFILSNVASVLGRQDAARENHMNNLDRIETFMKMHDTPRGLRNEVRNYYNYPWTRKKGYLDRSLLDNLPPKIQSDLFLHLNRSILQKVPLLRGASEELIEDLMRELEPRVGDRGDALYFIQSGQVEILGADRQKIATLSEGDFFGEMALVSDRSRRAAARSVSFCDLYVLHREAFEQVISAYPEFREHIHQVPKTRG